MMRQVEREKQDEMVERHLLRPIVEQIAVCPASIIVIDDIHFLDNEYLRRLRPIFDESNPQVMCTTGPYKGKQWSTRNGLFIVTSDLDENMASLSPSMDTKKAIQVIRELAKEQWGATSHMASLSTLVPFLPLRESQLVSIAQDQLEHLHELIDEMLNRKKDSKKLDLDIRGYLYIDWIGSLKFANGLAQTIYEEVKAETKRYGARPVNNFMQMNVYPLAIDIALELLDRGAKSKAEPLKSDSDSNYWAAISTYIPTLQWQVKIVNDIEMFFADGEMQFRMESIDMQEARNLRLKEEL
eukprot:CAMPEP_0184488302 /NCGR_PEP_ID=MMETSP0113_2-20130426/11120_1 /TAXON_ID=91329 /ORGANISM="Norrisiella sphaerica, Strain BC52" /LENGTH=297 /DNA_ID=CAMNT_0026870905 /DNA_START=398 /DNA_END=1291 /DNA_ORIENTATION=-